FEQRDAQGEKFERAGEREDDLRVGQSGLALDFDWSAEATERREPAVGGRGGVDAGDFRDGFTNLLVRVQARLPSGIRALREADVHGKNVIGIEAERRMGTLNESAHRGAGTSEQQQGESDLTGDQQAMHVAAMAAAGMFAA